MAIKDLDITNFALPILRPNAGITTIAGNPTSFTPRTFLNYFIGTDALPFTIDPIPFDGVHFVGIMLANSTGIGVFPGALGNILWPDFSLAIPVRNNRLYICCYNPINKFYFPDV